MTVCYFIQSHGPGGQVHRLIRTIRRQSPGSVVLVSHDASAGDLDLGPVADVARLTRIPNSEPARRGRFSGLAPYLRAVDWIAAQTSPIDWVVYLSAQDYPVRPLWDLESTLARASVDGYLPHWDARSDEGPWGRSKRGYRRYFFQYADPPSWTHGVLRAMRWLNGAQPLVHLHRTYGMQVGVRARRAPFTREFRCYVGTKFHILSGRAARYLREVVAANPALVDYYRRTVAPEESFVQTVLVNSGKFSFSKDPLRFADYSGRDRHARVLTEADLPALAAGGYYLARRFDAAVDARVLDRLDAGAP